MDHAEALEQIELAAVEPDGLERLMAGDTPDAAAVAGHLAGCATCVDELARIRRTSAVVRDAVRSEPDPALRDRTLAYVRAVGRDRSGAGGVSAAPDARAAAVPAAPDAPARHVPGPQPVLAGHGGTSVVLPGSRFGWAAGLAAALLIATIAGFAAGGAWLNGPSGGRNGGVAVLQDATETAMRIAALPDARAVALTATDGGGSAEGSLLFSAASGELVMTATGLSPLADGEQYGCWVEADGQRSRLGRMYWAGDLWAWSGPTDGLAALPDGAVFGVSLVPATGGAGESVLTGELWSANASLVESADHKMWAFDQRARSARPQAARATTEHFTLKDAESGSEKVMSTSSAPAVGTSTSVEHRLRRSNALLPSGA